MKLVVGEEVEVRSDEDGFRGSWQAGRITECGVGFREVRYHHLLDDDGLNHWVDRVTFLEDLGGEIQGCGRFIRPLRQDVGFGQLSEFTLHYGMCADALHNDAWWEGVVFDHADGAEKRRVFFPDMGDEMVFEIGMLRQAWDWDDECAEGWSQRGDWVFLKLVEELEEECPLTVSVKQLWYDLQEKYCFGEAGKWKCQDDGLWREPMLEMINSYFDMTVNDLFDSLGCLTDLDSQLVFVEDTAEKTDIVIAIPASYNGHWSVGFPLGNGGCSEGKDGLESGKSSIMQPVVGVWLPAENVLVSEPEFCPGVVEEYLRLHDRSRNSSLPEKLRKHLLYLGWKIEYRKEPSMTRFRYKAPDRKIYMSLIKICEAISRDAGALVTLPEDKVSRYLSKDLSGKILLERSEDNQNQMPGETSPTLTSPDPVFEPQYFPEAVENWFKYKNVKFRQPVEMNSLKVKQHLAFMGWSFTYTYRASKPELRYISPRGKSYFSLRTASEACIKDGGTLLNFEASGGSKPSENLAAVKSTQEPSTDLQHQPEALDVSYSEEQVREAAVHNPSQSNPRTVLSWLIDTSAIPPRAEVQYVSRKTRWILKEGRVSRKGIRCYCCDKVYSLCGFEAHAGCSSRKSSANIYLKDGRSLMECQRQMLDKAAESNSVKKLDPQGNHEYPDNDELCSVCHYEGNLMLCDRCPSSFHMVCLGLKEVPDGVWFCPSCRCLLCGRGDLKKGISEEDVLRCYQCEHQYHLSCLRGRNGPDLDEDAQGNRFCSAECKRICAGLNHLSGQPFALGADNLTWTLLKCGTSQADMDMLTENHSKLNLALGVMHECFEPLKDPRTKRDMVEDIIFSRSSEHNRLNYRGFYTVILEQNEELITAANVRIFGDKVAEVPLVGTRFQFRRLGMCRYLMNELEKKLRGLGIERLVLPAVPSVLKTWTNSLGFSQMTQSERLGFLSYTFLDFKGTTLCQKFLQHRLPRNPTPSQVMIRSPLSFTHPASQGDPIGGQASHPKLRATGLIMQELHEPHEELNINSDPPTTDMVSLHQAPDQPGKFQSSRSPPDESPGLERKRACLDIINLNVYKRRRLKLQMPVQPIGTSNSTVVQSSFCSDSTSTPYAL